MAVWTVEAKPWAYKGMVGEILCKWCQHEHGWRALVDAVEGQAFLLLGHPGVTRVHHADDGWYPDGRGGAYLVQHGTWKHIARDNSRPRVAARRRRVGAGAQLAAN